ncbi:MAG: tetratricopeptide repeat protein [Bacteroidia bacterium]|nr:tetratricopeptide repeat protein [Bacteroidia bacterium]
MKKKAPAAAGWPEQAIMFDNEENEGYEEYQKELSSALGRFENMIRAREHYYFDAGTLLNMIEHHQANNMLDKAEEVLQFGLKLHPHDFDLQLKQADLVSLAGKDAEALSLLNELEKKHPGEKEIYILKGNIYLDIEQYQQAIDNFEIAVDYADMPEDIYVNLAFAYRQLNNLPKAEDCILKALEFGTDGIMASEEFVDFYFITHQVERGIMKAEELIDSDPYDLMAWYALGNLYLRVENHEKAIEALEYCLAIDDDFLNAIVQLASAYVGAGRYEEAIELYKRTLRFSMLESYTLYCIGDCYFRLGQMSESRFYFRKSVKINPNYSDAFYGIAITYTEQNRWQEANHYIRKAIDLNRNISDYFLVAGNCELNTHCPESAYENYLQAINLDRKNLKAWYAILNCQIERGDYEDALGNCIDALAANSSDSELHFRLACYLFLNKRNKEAYAIFEKALHLDRNGYQIVFSICPQLHNDKHLNELIANYGTE